ncbi:MAG TPA: mechanosensitive ion channel domain-containing protein [Stellaceae bacterium]|jgi:small-conductance mechanosensitive channel|nr:mechanosensitive ion channel domain-containing protein [Stellaceae bacterium]
MQLRSYLAAAVILLALLGRAGAAEAPAAELTPGWQERAVAQIEAELVADGGAVPAIPEALSREWRSFDRDGSASRVPLDIGWIVIAALVALAAERATARGLSKRLRRRMRETGEPGLLGLVGLLASDLAGLAVFMALYTIAKRHVLVNTGISPGLDGLAMDVLVRWRVIVLVFRAVLRPREPAARLVGIADDEARRLSVFLSGGVFVVSTLISFARYGFADEDSGAAHVIGLMIAVLVCLCYAAMLVRSRAAFESLIRGRATEGVVGAIRGGLARAWLPLALLMLAGLFLTFVAGLSLGLLAYYRAVSSTLGVLFVVLVVERLTERAWLSAEPNPGRSLDFREMRARTVHHIVIAIGLVVAALFLTRIWSEAVEMTRETAHAAMGSVSAALWTLFGAYIVWQVVRLAIDRHLQAAAGAALPGEGDDDEEITPATRLQTILPLMRAAFAVLIGVVAVLTVLSGLGVNTAPLIAGAGVFGLAVSFGSQSLVRDVISGLFYMWDDAFRVGEYIDTGRLKGTVEKLGVRSVRLRHQNGPLHTIPYGQLGAVTNLSRDFATLKFNLRFDPRTDVETVRRATKQIGLAMQDDNPELAAEIMQPLKLQGIAEVVDNALVLRFKFTSRPVKPSWVQREYLKRMYKDFAEKNIRFASGAVFLQQVPPTDGGAAQPATEPPSQAADTAAAAVATAATVAVGAAAAMELADMVQPANTNA